MEYFSGTLYIDHAKYRCYTFCKSRYSATTGQSLFKKGDVIMADKSNGSTRKKTPVSPDGKPLTRWHCDTYCRKVRHVTCEGEKGIDDNAPDLCPYFDEMLF